MIEIRGVCKSFQGTPVLRDVHLTIRDREVFGLVGQSGVGKSTLLNCLIGLESYDSGSILVDGTLLEGLDDWNMRRFRKNMGMVFQNFSLIGRRDVFRNISLPMECWKYSKKEIKERVEELAELTGLKDKLRSRPAELSGGQKQRVAIARALTMNPRYLLCDECTSALDPKTTLTILEFLKDLQRRLPITIIAVTHEMSVVQNLCDRMAILEEGEISLVGNVGELFAERPRQLKRLMGEEEGRVSVLVEAKDLAAVRNFLQKRGADCRIAGGG